MTTDREIERVVVLRQAIAAWCVAICLVLCVVSHAQAEDILEPNFKAATDDECIREKECVWYHFVLATQLDASKGIATKNLNVKKWEKPVRVRIGGPGAAEYTELFESYINQLIVFLGQDLSIDDKYNYLIMFTDDIENEIKIEFHDVFQDMFGEGVALAAWNDVPDEGRKCHYLMLQDPKYRMTIYSYISFVQSDEENKQACLREIIYAGFGLSNFASSPIWDDAKTTQFYTKTERLVLAFLAQKNVRSGMSYDQLQDVFEKLYSPMMDYLDKLGVFDE